MKKTIIIVSLILAVSAMMVGIYFAWKKSKAILTPSTITEQPIGERTLNEQSPQVQPFPTQKLKILSNQPVFDYWVFYPVAASTIATTTVATTTVATTTITHESVIFYLSQDGKIFKINKDGQPETVTNEPILNLQDVKSSLDGKWIIIKYGDLSAPKFTIFNSETNAFEFLPENIVAAAFSPDSKKIVYLETGGDLVMKELTGAKPKTTKILSINQKDFDLNWILPEKIILTPKPSALYQTSVWIIDTKNKTIAPLNSEVSGLMIKWSASGKVGLEFISRSNGRENSLNLIDEQGNVQATLDFLTLPDKCLISEPKIYCAIPENIPSKTVLPDDYLKRAVYFRDNFYQIDINQNFLSEIFSQAEPPLDAVNLSLVNTQLLFINRYDYRLYQLNL